MIKHISNVRMSSLQEGHLVEQGGVVYRVVDIHRGEADVVLCIDYMNDRFYPTGQGVFRSYITTRGAVGQIRWHRAHRGDQA